jgi:hypothetical protein
MYKLKSKANICKFLVWTILVFCLNQPIKAQVVNIDTLKIRGNINDAYDIMTTYRQENIGIMTDTMKLFFGFVRLSDFQYHLSQKDTVLLLVCNSSCESLGGNSCSITIRRYKWVLKKWMLFEELTLPKIRMTPPNLLPTRLFDSKILLDKEVFIIQIEEELYKYDLSILIFENLEIKISQDFDL